MSLFATFSHLSLLTGRIVPQEATGYWAIEGGKGETVRRGVAAVGRFLRVERASGPFRRLVRLSAIVDRARGTARFLDGVLTITVPELHPRLEM